MKNNDLLLLSYWFGYIKEVGFFGSNLSPIKFEQTWAYWIGAGI